MSWREPPTLTRWISDHVTGEKSYAQWTSASMFRERKTSGLTSSARRNCTSPAPELESVVTDHPSRAKRSASCEPTNPDAPVSATVLRAEPDQDARPAPIELTPL